MHKIFFGCENDLQSWNPTFLGVRSPNPLPKASGLGNLTSRALLPGNDRLPADVFLPGWSGGRDAALDVTVVHPLQDATRARAAAEPGYALTYAYNNKMRVTADLCDQQGISFIPIVAESTGGWHKVALEQFKKLGSALARHTGQEESETINHLLTRTSVLLQKGLSALLLNRVPGHPAPDIGGVQ